MQNKSIWLSNKYKSYPKLDKNKEVDILIIGGGLTGISTLYHLRNTNLNIMLVEQNKIGTSTTGNSTGKLTILQNDLIDKIRNKYNDNTALFYLKSQIDAINNIVNVINKEKISCDLTKTDSYLYTKKDEEIDKIKSLETFLNKNNIKTYHDKVNIIDYKYIMNIKNTYIFNPYKFIHGLLTNNKFPIYENTSIIKIEKENNYYICYTKDYKIKTKYIVIASHYPYFITPYLFPFKVSLEKSYISASRYNQNPISLISYSNPFISIRTHKDYLIYLSNSNTINENVCDKTNYNELLKKLNDLKLKPNYLWSNIDIITKDGLPIIGKLKPNMFIGTGYNTWGLATSFLAGSIISDLILNKQNKYLKLFNPNRSLINLKDISKTISGYIKGLIKGTKYKCPHIGCHLIYNEIENTYDCPCHGSRFDKHGKCIASPSKKDITLNKKMI